MSTDLPLVSIITPSYNQAAFLEATICSVLEQDYPSIEYFVIDGGSKDGTQAILERYHSRLAYCVSEPDHGQAQAINKGLRRARGELVGWLNSDDILLPGTVRKIVQVLNDNPGVDVVYGRLQRMDAQGRPVPTPILPKDRKVFSGENFLTGCLVNQPGCFWRSKWMEKAGYLDEALHYVMDYEYWSRMLLAGAKFYRVSDELAVFRLSSQSKTVSQTEQMAVEMLKVVNLLAALPSLPVLLDLPASAIRRQVRQGRSLAYLNAVYGAWKQGRKTAALKWLLLAQIENPFALFDRRWIDLAMARFQRSLSIERGS